MPSVTNRLKNPQYLLGWGLAFLVAGVNWLFVNDLFGWKVASLGLAVVIAFWLSPIGSWFQSRSMGGRKATPDESAYIRHLMSPILERAGRGDWKPRIWVVETSVPNAWAFGLSDVLITEGLLQQGSPEQIQGVLAHEIGHLVCHHTLISLVARSAMAVASACVMVIMFLGQLLDAFLGGMAGHNERDAQGRAVPARGIGSIVGWIFKGIEWIMNKIFHLILLALGRLFEYEADAKTVEFGVGAGQISFLRAIESIEQEVGTDSSLLAIYTSTHPATGERIRRLEMLVAANHRANMASRDESAGVAD